VACTIPEGISNLKQNAVAMSATMIATLYAAEKGSGTGVAAGYAVFAALTIVPALQTRAKCNDIVGGVIPR
jgi:hypothetical protein